jgi:hypothetical protein
LDVRQCGRYRQAIPSAGQGLAPRGSGRAKDAYKDILKNPPPNATWNPDGAFAQVGKALAQGDVQGAKAIAADAIKELRSGQRPLPPVSDPVPPGAESMASAAGSIDVMA